MLGICEKCKEERTLFVYHVLPQQWHHGRGEIIYMCHRCIWTLDDRFPLNYYLDDDLCFDRVENFVGHKIKRSSK